MLIRERQEARDGDQNGVHGHLGILENASISPFPKEPASENKQRARNTNSLCTTRRKHPEQKRKLGKENHKSKIKHTRF